MENMKMRDFARELIRGTKEYLIDGIFESTTGYKPGDWDILTEEERAAELSQALMAEIPVDTVEERERFRNFFQVEVHKALTQVLHLTSVLSTKNPTLAVFERNQAEIANAYFAERDGDILFAKSRISDRAFRALQYLGNIRESWSLAGFRVVIEGRQTRGEKAKVSLNIDVSSDHPLLDFLEPIEASENSDLMEFNYRGFKISEISVLDAIIADPLSPHQKRFQDKVYGYFSWRIVTRDFEHSTLGALKRGIAAEVILSNGKEYERVNFSVRVSFKDTNGQDIQSAVFQTSTPKAVHVDGSAVKNLNANFELNQEQVAWIVDSLQSDPQRAIELIWSYSMPDAPQPSEFMYVLIDSTSESGDYHPFDPPPGVGFPDLVIRF